MASENSSVVLPIRDRLTMVAETLDNIADALPEKSEQRMAIRVKTDCLLDIAKEIQDQRHKDYLIGAYQTCATLLTSPRINKPQREIIEEVAYAHKAKLEEMGVGFEEER